MAMFNSKLSNYQFIVDLPINSMVIFHSYVSLPEAKFKSPGATNAPCLPCLPNAAHVAFASTSDGAAWYFTSSGHARGITMV